MRGLFYLLLPAFSLTMASLASAETEQLPPLMQEIPPTQSAPIPAVNSGTIELQEIKPTATLDVKTSQSRVFRTKSKILRISVSDPSIAEPVVVSEREFILIGKAPGAVSLTVWCEGSSKPIQL